VGKTERLLQLLLGLSRREFICEDINIRKPFLYDKLTIHNVIFANYPLLLNIIYCIHIVLVIMYVSYGRYQIEMLECCVAWRMSLRRV